jgi:UDP-N-acetyl-D-mannosaminuronic acid dehydrogenase
MSKKVAVIGLGYIGLPTAAVLASSGCEVVGVDVSARVVDTVNSGNIHIVEPGLAQVVSDAVRAGRLRASLVVPQADAYIIAVPTPLDDGKKPDLSYVDAAAKALALVVKRGDLVILESTSPVGTTERVAAVIAAERSDLNLQFDGADEIDLAIAHCPERVLPGKVLEELVANDRIVGGLTPKCAQKAVELYEFFVKGECMVTNARTAELVKLAENAYRDVNIAYANEMSMVCDSLNVNPWELISLANRHPRVNILNPGPGVGGHCIAVDPWFIVDSAPSVSPLIKTARQVNDAKPSYVIAQVRERAAALNLPHGQKPVIACLGLAFKADIDDLRESPAIDIVKQLSQSSEYELLAVEPNISALPSALSNMASLCGLEDALAQANVVVLLVDHREFKALAMSSFSNKELIDTRGVFGTSDAS